MNWYRGDWNYHPLLPPKRIQNIEEIEASGCNVLYWCSMGSGMIGPQILEEELFGQPANRTRFYGFLNDSEFAIECKKRGIASFGVIWRSQLWEFPAEFDENETTILSFNKLRGVGEKGWIGIRELSTDRYPKIFPSIRRYFPNGLKNSRGQLVEDFLEEFTAKTLDGNKIRSMWLQVPEHEHQCYTPCSNNEAYQEYLYFEIRKMIEAGTSGVFLDECSTSRHALLNSGCFCYDCMTNFRDYIKQNAISMPNGVEIASFDYGEYLGCLGYTDENLNGNQQEDRLLIPLYREFIDFMNKSDVILTKKLISYIRSYSKDQNTSVLVSANLYNLQPEFAPVRKLLDYYGGENTDIELRNDGYYRFVKGFIGEQKGFLTQDYSPYVLSMVEDVKNGNNDTYTLMLMEALAHGIMNSVPYGSWLLNYAKEAFWPDISFDKKLGRWQQTYENLFGGDPQASLAILYDQRSAYDMASFGNGHIDAPRRRGFQLFHQITQLLSEEGVLFNVLYVDESEPLTAERLKGYGSIILPDCIGLTSDDIAILKNLNIDDTRVVAVGKVIPDLTKFVFRYRKTFELVDWAKKQSVIVSTYEKPKNFGFSLDKTSNGYILHLLSYNLNNLSRQIEELPPVTFRLEFSPRKVDIITLPGVYSDAHLQDKTLTIYHAGIYTACIIDV